MNEPGAIGQARKHACQLYYRGMPGPGSKSGCVREQREEGGDRGFSERKLGKGITFEM